jgi:hypothetical protein
VPDGGQLPSLVVSLFAGTLKAKQREAVRSLRAWILALMEEIV